MSYLVANPEDRFSRDEAHIHLRQVQSFPKVTRNLYELMTFSRFDEVSQSDAGGFVAIIQMIKAICHLIECQGTLQIEYIRGI